MISIIIFLLLFTVATVWFIYCIRKVVRNILLGKTINRTDNFADRLKTMLLVALGQTKMRGNPVVDIMHLFLYIAFIITQIELAEIIFDGATGSHRAFRPFLGGFYTFLVSSIEILSVLGFIATTVFLYRRNLLKIPRLVKSELNGWPKLDANIILIVETILICLIFMMNGADEVLYSRGLSAAENLNDGSLEFTFSSHLGPFMFGGLSEQTLHLIERVGWWGHIVFVLAFLVYLPYSKHLHILLAFPNTFYSNLNMKGQLPNIETVTNEVKAIMDSSFTPPAVDPNVPIRFGAKDVTDLTWKQLLDS